MSLHRPSAEYLMNFRPSLSLGPFIVIWIALICVPIHAQVYELGNGSAKATATFSGGKLTVQSGNQKYEYTRAQVLDSRDGKYLGYYCAALRKSIRWPTSGSGSLYRLNGRTWEPSNMRVVRLMKGSSGSGSTSTKGTKGTKGVKGAKNIVGSWSANTTQGGKHTLVLNSDQTYTLKKHDEFNDLVSSERGKFVVTQSTTDKQEFILSCKDSNGFKSRCQGKWNDQGTKFRLIDSKKAKFVYQRASGPMLGGGKLGGGKKKLFRRRVTVFQPNKPLSPVTIKLKNTHQQEIVLIVATHLPRGKNWQSSMKKQQINLKPDAETSLVINRDSGGVNVTYFADTKEIIRQVPVAPRPLYDIAVYQKAVKSVEIDGTKNPPAKKINYALKSTGVYTIPAGTEVTAGHQVDIFDSAKEANNTGGVARYPKPKEFRK